MAYTADDAAFLHLITKSADRTLADEAAEALAGMVLKWTYNPNQSRVGGRFASGTGSNITSGGDVQVSGRQGGSIVAAKPVNAAAARLSSGKPVNGAAARLTPQIKPPPPVKPPAGKPKPQTKPPTKPDAKPKPTKPAAKPTPGPEAATRSPHTAIGSQDGDRLTVSHRPTEQTRQAAAREASHRRAIAAQQRQELAAARASLAAARAKAKASKVTNAQRDAAVASMKREYGIPKSLRHVSKDRQQAASAMDSATRSMVTDRAKIADAKAQVAAVRAQYRKGQAPATTAYLNAQLAKAQARLNAANSSLAQQQARFNAAAKKWRGH